MYAYIYKKLMKLQICRLFGTKILHLYNLALGTKPDQFRWNSFVS